MSIEIREFRDNDAEGLAIVSFESFRSFLKERMTSTKPGSAESWKKQARCRDEGKMRFRTFVALDESQKVVGFISITLNGYRLGVLEEIGVLPSSGHKGIGTMLFQAADRFWRENQTRKVYTCVSSINPKAYAFYQKQGFIREGILKDHFFDGVDEFQLALFY